jgi:hypothetical protein
MTVLCGFAALPRRIAHHAGGATAASWPLASSASATQSDAFCSSMKALSYRIAYTRPFGTAIAWRISMKRPSITR